MEQPTVLEAFYAEVDRIKAGEGLGLVATSRTTQPTFKEWMSDGGMSTAVMQPGEASWASFKCGGGPHMSEFV